jgi:acetyl-CoA acetyltransferase
VRHRLDRVPGRVSRGRVGEVDVALAVGVEQMGKAGLLGGGGGSGIRTEGVVGSGLMPAVFGQAGMEHMRKYGTTPEQFAKVAVKNHKHATKNRSRSTSERRRSSR